MLNLFTDKNGKEIIKIKYTTKTVNKNTMDIHKEIKFDHVNLNNATNVRDTNENLLQLEQMEAENEKEVQEHSWLSDVMQSNLTTVTGSRSRKKYICLICKTDFPTILSAITHIKGHRKPFCYICLSIFQTEIELVSVTKFFILYLCC